MGLRKEHKAKGGGLTEAGRKHFERTGESKNLRPGVKKPDSELTATDQRRKGGYLARAFGPNAPGGMQKPNGEPTRRALSAAAWGEPVPKDDSGRARLFKKGQNLLERYKNSKKK